MVDYARAVVESVLRGSHGSKVSLEHVVFSDLAESVRDACAMSHCASPYALAESLGVDVVDVELPNCMSICVDDSSVFVRPVPDLREHGLLVFRGIARHVLSRHIGCYTEADAIVLAAELAAPSGLVIRRGIEAVIERQHWAPVWFLMAWEEYLCPPASSWRIA